MNIHQKLLGCQNSFSDCYTRINSKCKKFLFLLLDAYNMQDPKKMFATKLPTPWFPHQQQMLASCHITQHIMQGQSLLPWFQGTGQGTSQVSETEIPKNTPRDTCTATSIIRPKARIVEEFGFLNISTARIRQKRGHNQILKNMQRHLSTSL